MKITFFGAPYFSSAILQNLIKENIIIDQIITHPDQPVGRKKIFTPTELKQVGKENNIPVKEFNKLDKQAYYFLTKQSPDLFIVVAYGHIIPKNFLQIPKLGALNIHPSLLPNLRGASPIQNALQQGLSKTGSTIMLMDAGMDTGPIVKQREINILPNDKYPDLEKKLIILSSRLLTKILQMLFNNKTLPTTTPQNNAKATYTKIIKKEDGLIQWEQSAEEIYNQWRAFFVWPKIFTSYNKQKLILTEIEKVATDEMEEDDKFLPGQIIYTPQKNILVKTGNGFIKINKLQLAGKKEMGINDFINGQPDFINQQLKGQSDE